jgi:hypothetical protein
VARWRPQVPAKSDDELLVEFEQRYARLHVIPYEAQATRERVRREILAWCVENDVDWLEMLRLRVRRRHEQLQAECEAAGLEWRGPTYE